MGGQQFGAGGLLLDTRGLDRVLELRRRARARSRSRPGIQWPALLDVSRATQAGEPQPWGDRARSRPAPTGSSIGGALAANVHGRGLRCEPIVADVESFTLVDADGEVAHAAAATENAELFRLAIGGYGLFGVDRLGDAAARAAAEGRARGRGRDVDELIAGVRGAHRATASSTATSSSRSTPRPTTSCAAASSPATGRSTTTTPIPRGPARALAATTGASCSTSPTPTRRSAFELYSRPLPGDHGPDLLVRHPPVRRLPRRLPRAARRRLERAGTRRPR